MTLAEQAFKFLDTGEISQMTEELLDEIYLQEQIIESELDDPEFNGFIESN